MAFTLEEILEEFVETEWSRRKCEYFTGYVVRRYEKEKSRQLDKYHRLYRTPERLEARAKYMREHRRKKREGLK